ncbi:hypothetical protein [Nocardia ninae]|uniref:DUF4351 domain-containing protein n=1 Tax=Nocardia ninae NBRC 108245 TaxID=1210091 RepID=A0A511MPF3_9NOCA|nr:hypothetical protein [Nocardia ninae]GEM42493.1 hypothetical protein NN4_70120 [Nocardia ninae NBRC 108245]
MPSIHHEAPLELLRHNPELAAALLADTGIRLPTGATATISDSNLSTCNPPEFRADAVTLLRGIDGDKLAVITESQSAPPKRGKRRAWPAYVAVAQSQHDCDAVLVVIAASPATAHACSRTIHTGHPGFSLAPIVIGPHNTPDPTDPAFARVAPELTVLAALTHALDLSEDANRRLVLDKLATLDRETRTTYTRFVRHAASDAARKALEELMASPTYRDDWVDGLLDQGRAEGEARGEAKMLLRALVARGFAVSDDLRARVLSTSDTEQLEAWMDKAAVADSLDVVFGD